MIKLRHAIGEFARLTALSSESALLQEGPGVLRELVRTDDWLPDQFAIPDPGRYQQYLLHCDSAERFSIVSFVWGPSQSTPVHNHTVWGLIGMLRGAERSQRFSIGVDGCLKADGEEELLAQGAVDVVSPALGDIHKVRNAFDDRVSISIHVYGANIGAVRRSVYNPDGTAKTFISGYSSAVLPNVWDRSRESKG